MVEIFNDKRHRMSKTRHDMNKHFFNKKNKFQKKKILQSVGQFGCVSDTRHKRVELGFFIIILEQKILHTKLAFIFTKHLVSAWIYFHV